MSFQHGKAPPMTPMWASYKLILSVDEDPFRLYTQYKLLSAAGYAVLSALDGEEALRLFKTNPIDLVLLNYALPDTNGLLVARSIKDCEPHVSIILLSGLELPKQPLTVVDLHLHNWQTKEVLLASIREWMAFSLERRHLRRAAGF